MLLNKNITSVEELLFALNTSDKTQYGAILRRLDLCLKKFEPYQSWIKSCYTRNCIEENDDFELILLCWEPGQSTPIHGHGGEECWVYFLKGDFEERIYTLDDAENPVLKKRNSVGPGGLSYMENHIGVHSLKNCSSERGLSLHLYANPIRTCKVFDEDASEFIEKEMSYHTKQEAELV